MSEIAIDLRNVHFDGAETPLATFAGLAASTYRYGTGVAGLRIANDLGHVALLPFQGQQIWDAWFLGRRLTMQSIFPEPVQTRDYLANYGAYFIHCGATAMGNPGPSDTHPLHGELPNAPYQEAQLIAGTDAEGAYMGLTGSYRHASAFTHHYVARPTVKLRPGSSRVHMALEVQNLRHAPMEFMYLAHINFRPCDGATLVDTVPDDPQHARVRSVVLPGFQASAEHLRMIEALRSEPGRHRSIEGGLTIDPEIVLSMDCRADDSGWAHGMQLRPDGGADFVSHRPDQLDHAVRWIVRNGDEDAMGLMLPATAEADGYAAEKAKGHVRTIPPQGSFRCAMMFGALDANEAATLRRKIDIAMGR